MTKAVTGLFQRFTGRSVEALAKFDQCAARGRCDCCSEPSVIGQGRLVEGWLIEGERRIRVAELVGHAEPLTRRRQLASRAVRRVPRRSQVNRSMALPQPL